MGVGGLPSPLLDASLPRRALSLPAAAPRCPASTAVAVSPVACTGRPPGSRSPTSGTASARPYGVPRPHRSAAPLPRPPAAEHDSCRGQESRAPPLPVPAFVVVGPPSRAPALPRPPTTHQSVVRPDILLATLSPHSILPLVAPRGGSADSANGHPQILRLPHGRPLHGRRVMPVWQAGAPSPQLRRGRGQLRSA
jgi:hypothetical protein